MVEPAMTESMMTSKRPCVHTWCFRRLRGRCWKTFSDDDRLVDVHVLGLVHGTAQDTGDEERGQEG